MPQPHSRSLRVGRVDEVGRTYLLTTVTVDRQPVFEDPALARICIGAMRFQDESGRTSTLAYVLMPDHLHWMVTLESGSLAGLMRSMKSFSARLINRLHNKAGDVWQHGYHDHALRSDEDLRKAARYLVDNPVRAGLVQSLWDYPHWDAVWIETEASLW